MKSTNRNSRTLSFCVFILVAALTIILNTHFVTDTHAAYVGARNALDFDGVNDYVLASPVSITSLSDTISIATWIKITDDTTEQIIMSNEPDNWAIYYRGDVDDTLWFSFSDVHGLYHNDWYSTVTLSAGQWYHIAIVYDGSGTSSGTSIYINGVEGTVDSNWHGGLTNNATRLALGIYASDLSTSPFSGLMDEVSIWDKVLSPAEIRTNMYKPLNGSESGLQLYYNFDQSSGTSLPDLSPNANHGTLTNMFDSDWVTSGSFAGSRNAVDFDGVDDYILAVPISLTSLSDTISIDAWIKITDDTTEQIIMSNEPDNWAIYYRGDVDDTLWFSFSDVHGLYHNDWYSTATLSAGQWYHIAIVYDGSGTSSGTSIYINGFEGTVDSNWHGGLTNNATRLALGIYAFDLSSSPFNGLMDEVRIWNIARSTVEIQDNMFRTLDGDEPGLVAYYRFDQYNALDQTIMYDLTANGNNGTLTNMDVTTDWVASAAFNTWIGSQSSDWTVADNWSSGLAPLAMDNVGIYSYPNGNDAILDSTTTVEDLVVATGATLTLDNNAHITVSNWDFVNGTAVWTSGAVSQETRPIDSTGDVLYPLAEVNVAITTQDDLTSLQTIRMESDHPNKTGTSIGGVGWGRYWTLTPDNCTACQFNLTLSHSIVPDSDTKVCKHPGGLGGAGWDCDRTGSDAVSVWRDGLTSFSDWAVGANVGPTSVTLSSVSVVGEDGWLVLVTAVSFALFIIFIWRRKS